MNLNLAWQAPTPVPTCGYKATYRRNYDPSYTESDISGTSIIIPIDAPASYEGAIKSDCCSDSVSQGVAFGVNAYVLLSASSAISNQQVNLTVSSPYGNPYGSLLTGTVNISGGTSISFHVTYTAGSTSQQFNIGTTSGVSILSTAITAIGPIFDNGGQLQQLDVINTPPYFNFYYSGEISGNTWNGSPGSLPSFALSSFSPTEVAVDGVTVIAGNLAFSYILGSVFPNAFDSFTIEVFDPSSSTTVIGSSIISKTPLGLRQGIIGITKLASPLSTSTEFTMKFLWPDDTVFDIKQFYLPSF